MELKQNYVRRRNMSLTHQNNDQFLHTLKWNMMLQHFYDNISLKRRKICHGQFCMSFTGANAVNILFSFLKKNPTLFSSCDVIKRSNIISLCNLYLQTGNIEGVNLGSNLSPLQRNKFKDSSFSYYRFTERAVSALVQKNQSPVVNFKIPVNGGNQLSLCALSTKDADIKVPTSPISKHGSVESLFQRIQKTGVRRASNPKTDFSDDFSEHLSFSPRCIKKLYTYFSNLHNDNHKI